MTELQDNQSKLPDAQQMDNVTAEKSNENRIASPDKKEIRGWLTFFLIMGVGAGSLLSLVFYIVNFSADDYAFSEFSVVTKLLGYIIVSFDILLYPILAGYTIYSFYTFKPNAVALGKLCVLTVFISNLLTILVGEYTDSGVGSFAQTIRGLIWGTIWFIYLCASEQVNDLFPKQERKLFKRDKYLIAVMIIVPLLYFTFVIIEGTASEINIPQPTKGFTLKEGEYSDGKIAFMPTSKLQVEEQTDENGHIYFILHSDNNEVSTTITSAFETNNSPAFFLECMQNWKDHYFDDFRHKVILNQTKTINGNKVYIKTLEYSTDPVIKWSFVLVFNKENTICCLISSYYTDEYSMSDFNKLFTSIRFD